MEIKTVQVCLDENEFSYETVREEVQFYIYLMNKDGIVPDDWHDDTKDIEMKIYLDFEKVVETFVEDHRIWDRKITTFLDTDKPYIDSAIAQLKSALARLELVEYEKNVVEEDEDNK